MGEYASVIYIIDDHNPRSVRLIPEPLTHRSKDISPRVVPPRDAYGLGDLAKVCLNGRGVFGENPEYPGLRGGFSDSIAILDS